MKERHQPTDGDWTMKKDQGVKKEVNVYSNGEKALMEMSQNWRGRALLPLLKFLSLLRVTPNQLTYLSLFFGVIFCFIFVLGFPGAKMIAFFMLAIHVLLDGIDGPLARYLGKESNKGSFTDSTIDQLVVAFSTIALIYSGDIGIIPGSLYIFFYTLVVVFAMIRNSLTVPYSWLVRPRFFVYSWLLVEVYLWPGSIDFVLWIFTGLLAINVVSGFFQIRKKL